jgi:hypothetical protein
MDLASIPQDLLIARGQYATIRSAHEDAKKQMQMMCGSLGASAAQVLRAVQPDSNGLPDLEAVFNLLSVCSHTVEKMGDCASDIHGLAAKRASIKPAAWPKTR